MPLENFIMNPNLLAMPIIPAGKTADELRAEYGLEKIVDVGSNENPLGPSPLAIEAVRSSVVGVNRYSAIGGPAEQLKELLAQSMGPGFDKDNIILGNGSVDVLRMAAELFLYQGGESIIRRNAFPLYELLNTLYGGECVLVDTNPDYTFDLSSMLAKITERTRLIFLTNPDNPTGMIFTQKELDAFIEQVPPSALVILDHAYEEYAAADAFPDVRRYVLEGRNVLITRTFSKIYGLASMRIGYGIAKKEIISYMKRSRLPFYTGSIGPMAAIAALSDSAHVQHGKQVTAEGKRYLYQEFEKLGLTYLPTEAYFIMVVGFKGDTTPIAEAMMRRGVIIGLGHSFRMPDAFRVTVGRMEDNQRLIEALKETLEEVKGTI
ncbi:MAG: aminotransferase class I/II-fold pyridoxal phosphate-dependent enzyme [Anaerolineaceae bacterium]|nr:aminotransferase class I/II-fold pyridoxal phosphate-dependent enzyme [Anaerolineaceae bacterium]